VIYDRYVLGQHKVLRDSNKIESVGLNNARIIIILLRK